MSAFYHYFAADNAELLSVETHVWLLAGQSNMVGLGLEDGGAPYPAGTLSFNKSTQSLEAAQDPMQHWDNIPGSMGLARGFATAYRAANPNVNLIFIPAARNGSGFHINNWNKGNPHYNYALAALNSVLALDPSYQFKGTLWLQGEADAINPTANANFTTALTQMIADMRTDVAVMVDKPFVMGMIAGTNPSYISINKKLVDVIMSVPKTSLSSSDGIEDSGDEVHYSGAGLREMGERMFAGVARAVENISGALPQAPLDIVTFAEDTKVRLQWYDQAVITDYNTDYIVEYKLATESQWSVFQQGQSTDLVTYVTGLTNDVSYNFRIAAINANGQSSFSAVVSATPSVIADAPVAISGLVQWHALWDRLARTTVIDGSDIKIASLSDKSGNNHTLTNSVMSSRPKINVNTLNGLDVGTFNRTILSGDVLGLSEFTVSLVCRVTDPTLSNNVIYGNVAGNIDAFWTKFTQSFKYYSQASGTTIDITSLNANEYYIVTIRQDVDSIDFYINGAFITSTNITSPVGSNAFCLGALANASNDHRGDTLEISVYDRALTSSELNQLHAYFSKSSGITLVA